MKILLRQIKTTFHFWFLTYSQLSYSSDLGACKNEGSQQSLEKEHSWYKDWLHLAPWLCHGSLVWSHGIQLIKRLDGNIGNSSHLSIINFTFPPSQVNRSSYWSISIRICSNSEIHKWSLQIKPYILFGF